MESLSDETWDAVICGTGLSQSLLALALSRSKKRVLHLDPNDVYGGDEAALSLQEVDAWARTHAGTCLLQDQGNGLESGNDSDGNVASTSLSTNIFRNASVWKNPNIEGQELPFPREYSLALAPQIIHTKSRLLSQLVSSKAYRQVEFLAVGSFFVYSTTDVSGATLARIPSSREDVFLAQSIPARSKRALMKFLKFVIDYNSEDQKLIWQANANKPLSEFLIDVFKLDYSLRNYILALTLALDGNVNVEDGLATIHRHLSSIGLFGPGFCAVYPKWGGLSEIAQVGCRAGAVGGGIYMLNTPAFIQEDSSNSSEISLRLPNEVSIQTTTFVSSQRTSAAGSQTIARLVAIVNSPLQSLFDVLTESAPTPAVAVVAFPSGSFPEGPQSATDVPIYAFVHSSDTGECPAGQSVVYLTMQITSQSPRILDTALTALLQTVTPTTDVLYKLYYEQAVSARQSSVTPRGSATVFEFPSPSLGLAFDDGSLDAVKEAWRLVMKDEASDDLFMKFEDREGTGDDDAYV